MNDHFLILSINLLVIDSRGETSHVTGQRPFRTPANRNASVVRITSAPAALLLISARPLVTGHEFFVTEVQTRGALQGSFFQTLLLASYNIRLMAALGFNELSDEDDCALRIEVNQVFAGVRP
jgi:hypothetical protein